MTVTGAAGAVSTLKIPGATGVTLSAANPTQTLALAGGRWTTDISAAIRANQDIVLDGAATLTIRNNQVTTYTGRITGNGTIQLANTDAYGGVLLLSGSSFFNLPRGGSANSQTLTLKDGVWSSDVTAAVLNNNNIGLTVPATIRLPAGRTTYTGALSISAGSPNASLSPSLSGTTLTLVAGTGGSTLLVNGRTIVLPETGQTVPIAITSGGEWTADLTGAMLAGQAVAPGGVASIFTLPAGTTTYAGRITGPGAITLIAAAGAGSTLVVGSQTIALPAAGQRQTLIVSDSGALSVDVTASLLASQPITFTGIPMVATVPAGTTVYTGTLTGDGAITLRSSGAGGGTLVVGGQRFVLNAANAAVTVTRTAGAWTSDITAQLLARQPITLTGRATLALPAGTVTGPAVIDGAGTIVLRTGAAGGATVTLGKTATFALPEADQIAIATLADGAWTLDVSASFLAGQDITLLPATLTAITLPAGETRYAGAIGGSGRLQVTSAAGGSTLALPDGTLLTLPDAGTSVTLVRAGNGGWTADVSDALVADRDIVLNGTPATATLAAGVTTYTGDLTGAGRLTLTSAAGGPGTLVLADGTRFELPDANETQTAILKDGRWTVDVTAAMMRNQDIVLSKDVPAIVDLPKGNYYRAGVIDYTGKLIGDGILIVETENSILTLPDGYKVDLAYGAGSPAQRVTLTRTGGAWSADYTEELLADRRIVLNGATTLTLPAGTTVHNGGIGGTGTLTLKSGSDGGARLHLGGTTFVIAGPDQSLTATLGASGWAIDYGAALAADTDIHLATNATATLKAGTTDYSGKITGNDNGIVVTSSATGGSTLLIRGEIGGAIVNPLRLVLGAANQTQTATLRNGVWNVDITASILANQDIVLTTDATVTLPAGMTSYTGNITGQGKVVVRSGAGGPATLQLTRTDQTIALTTANQTLQTELFASGAWTMDLTDAIANNRDIVLDGAATARLKDNVGTNYTGRITGTGSIQLLDTGVFESVLVLGATTAFNLARGPITSQTIALTNGVWTADVTDALLNNTNIGITVPTTIRLPSGTTTYTGNLVVNAVIQHGAPGADRTTLTVVAGAGGSTLVMNGRTIALPDTGQAQTFTLTTSGAWSADLTDTIKGNGDITLTGIASSVALPAGVTRHGGVIDGTGAIALTGGTAGSTLVLKDGTTFTLAAGATQTAILSPAGWRVDASAAAQAGKAITLSAPTTIALPAGTTNYGGTIAGTKTLTLTSPNVAGGSTLVMEGKTFTLPSANQTLTATVANGVWTTDVTASLAANQGIVLGGGQTIATLAAGSSTYTGALGGSGTLILTSAAGGGSTVTLRGAGVTFVLPSAGDTQIATRAANGSWSVDVSASLAAGRDVVLTTDATAILPAGTTAYAGTLTGTGVLTLTAAGYPATFKIPGLASFALTAANPSAIVTYANGAASVDIGAAIVAGRDIALVGTATATLPPGTTTYRGAITGAGTIRVTSGAGAATLVVGAQRFVLPAGGISQTLTLSGGVWTADIGAAVRANQPVTLTGDTTLTLGGGTTAYTGALNGTGTIRLAAPTTATATLVVAGVTVSLASPGQVLTLRVANGVVGAVDATAAMRANQAIALSAPTLVALPGGETRYTGALTGAASLTLTAGAAGASTLVLADGTTFALAQAGQTATFTRAATGWTANATTAFLAGQALVLNQPTTVTLPAGATRYTGTITGTAPLTFVSSGAGSVTIGAQTFTFPVAGQSQTLTRANGVWTADLGAAIRANQAIALDGTATVALGGGTTTYTGALSGSGTIVLTAPANSGATLVLSASGKTVSLPSAGARQIVTVTNGQVTAIDVTADLLANRAITLGMPLTLALPAGRTTYTGTLNGNGSIRVTGAAAGATLAIGNRDVVLAAAGQTQILTRTNGIWSADVTAAVLANQNVVLSGDTTVTLPAGTTTYTGTVTGQGTLTVAVAGGAAGVLKIGTATTYAVAAGQSVRQTLRDGRWARDVTAQVLANQDIVLDGAAAIYLSGDVRYTGRITGQGSLVVTAPANRAATMMVGGRDLVSIPTAGLTTSVSLANGVWTRDLTAHVLANENITLVVPATLDLPAGITRYTGAIGGSGGVVTVTSGASGGATLELAGGRTFVLPAANQRLVLTATNGQWTSDVAQALSANQAITLTGAATATLAAGVTTHSAAIDGTGRLTLTAAAGAGSTIVIAGRQVALAAGQSTTITLVNGAVAADVTAAIAANQPIVLSGAMAALLPAGTTTFTGAVSGVGTLTLTSANAAAGSTIAIGGRTVTLPAANETVTLSRAADGSWTTDISLAIANNQAVVLNGAATLQLLPGLQADRATITGTGSIVLKAANVPGGSSFTVDGRTYVLAAPGATATATLAGGVWTTDVTALLRGNQPIALFGANTATLPAGTTTYSGALTGAGTLSVTSGAAGPATLVIGGRSVVLASASQTLTLTMAGATVTGIDVGRALAANQAIALSDVPAAATLAAGTTTYSGMVGGTGTLTLTSAATGGSTLAIGGQTFTLATANQTQILTRSASGGWSADVTAAMLANQAVTLTGQPTTLTLSAGNLTYGGKLGGSGTIAVSSGPAGGANFAFGGATGIYFAAANQTGIVTVANGVVTSVDMTAALLANQNINVSVATTATLPAGVTTYTGNLGIDNGATLTLTSRGGGASLVLPNGTTFVLPEAGETIAFTYRNGAGWSADATAAAVAGHDIVLNQPTTITLSGGTIQAGAITGSAPLTLVSGPKGGSLRLADGTLFTLPGANQTQTATFANGVWTTDIGANLRADQPLVLNGNNVATLAPGVTTVTRPVTGAGVLRIVSANAPGGSTLVVNGRTFALPGANTTNVLTLKDGQWRVDVTSAIANRQPIVLDGVQTVRLNAGTTATDAAITGTGALLVTSSATGASTLRLGGASITLPDADTTVTLKPVAGGGWTADVSAALLAGRNLTLSGSLPSTVTLPAGTTTYAGKIDGAGTLVVTSSATGGSTLVIGDRTFALPGSGQTHRLTLANGAWSVDVSAAIAAGKDLTLDGTVTTATLAAGDTTYRGRIAGTGSITLTTGAAGGGTLVLADGTRFVLGAASQTATAILADGRWSLDVTASILADKPVALTGATLLTLPAGTTTYRGAITGSGQLTVASGTSAASLVIAGRTITVPAGGIVETLSFANGVLTDVDITAAVLAGKDVVLGGASSLTLPAGAIADPGRITGAGVLTLRTGAAGGAVTIDGGQRFDLPDAGSTATATLAAGVWTMDATALIAAGKSVALTTRNTVATLAPGTSHIKSLSGDGTLTLTAATAGAVLKVANGESITIPAAGQSVAARVSDGHVTIDITAQIAANQRIVLGSAASAVLPAGQSTFTGTITGTGTLTLYGARTGASSIAIGGKTYTVAQNQTLSLTAAGGVFTTAATTDITAALIADQPNIVFTGGRYIVDIPKGQTVSYNGVMTGEGVLEITGGGRLILNRESNFTLPKDQIKQYFVNARAVEQVYHGINLGKYGAPISSLVGRDPPAVIVREGATLAFGDPSQNKGYGNIAQVIGGHGAAYNINNIQVDGTLDINYWGGGGYALPLGSVSGSGLITNNQGSVSVGGDNTFTGQAQVSGFNFGGSHSEGTMAQAKDFANGFVLTFSSLPPTSDGGPGGTPTDGIVVIPQDIYEDHYGNSIHNQGPGLIVFAGEYHYNDSGNRETPSLSNPLLDQMAFNGNASHKRFFSGGLRQFGDGTTDKIFISGNEVNTYIDASGTTGFNYNGTVRMNATYGAPGTSGNVVIIGTPGNHVIFTQPTQYNGITKIEENAILQLGDGTLGNGETITTFSAQGPVTGYYSTSSGNGSILTMESPGGHDNNRIILDGRLIVMNTPGARNGIGPMTLSHISGTGSLSQEGTQRLTLLEDTIYTGRTDIANGTLAIAGRSGWAGIGTSSGVNLLNAAAVFDVSQAGDQRIQNLSGAAGGTVALGGGTLVIAASVDTAFAGRIVDGGIAGGVGGGVTKTGTGVLELGGASTYTGATIVEAGGLRLAGATLATSRLTIAAGTLLSGHGTVAGPVAGDGAILATGGTLALGSVAGTGPLDIAGGATLVLGVATTRDVTFLGAGTLVLEDPAAFGGTIRGFGADTTIDLDAVAATGVTYDAAAGVLHVMNAAVEVARLRIGPPPAGETYRIASDGDGGSRIVAAAPVAEPAAGLILTLSEDAYRGDAQFVVSVNGVQQGGVRTVTALHALGQTQDFVLPGAFGSGALRIDVTFLNDAYGGSAGADRNLYLDSVTRDGVVHDTDMTILGGARSVVIGGATTYRLGMLDTITLAMSEDAYRGDAQFIVSVDGVKQGGVRTVTALHARGESQTFDIVGNFGAGSHAVTIDFLNDAYGGTATTDRNLYVQSITYNGQKTVLNAAQLSKGARTYGDLGIGTQNVAATDGTFTSTGTDTIHAGSSNAAINLLGPSATLHGGGGTNIVVVGGDDTIVANDARMTVTGGEGSLTFVGGSAPADIVAGSGATTATAGAGGLTFTAGTGSATIHAGSGPDLIRLVNGLAGGRTIIDDFTPGVDQLDFRGYDPAAIARAIEQATVTGGSMTIGLPDHSQIVLHDITSLTRASYHVG